MSSRDVNGFGFSLYLSTSKLYKCMQHTSGPTVCETNTHIQFSSIFFFQYRFCFTKCACSLEQVRVMLATPPLVWQESAGLTKDEHWCSCPESSISWVTFHIHRDAEGKFEQLMFFVFPNNRDKEEMKLTKKLHLQAVFLYFFHSLFFLQKV